MKHGSLFSGIGGFDIAAEWMGWENMFHCEINEFCNKILKHYWPDAKSYTDIKTTDFSVWRGKVDIVTGGFPCQPYSAAGKRKGKADDRHLWPFMLAAIKQIQPRWIVGENVSGLLNWNRGMVLDEIKADLEAAGFEVLPPLVLPACAVNAPHRRDRVWIVAYNPASINIKQGEIKKVYGEKQSSNTTGICNKSYPHANSNGESISAVNGKEGCGKLGAITDTYTKRFKAGGELQIPSNKKQFAGADSEGIAANTKSKRHKCGKAGSKKFSTPPGQGLYGRNDYQYGERWSNFPTQPPLCSGDDGLSGELAGITFSKHRNESIKSYGNSVVPQIVFEIFKAIEQMNTQYGN